MVLIPAILKFSFLLFFSKVLFLEIRIFSCHCKADTQELSIMCLSFIEFDQAVDCKKSDLKSVISWRYLILFLSESAQFLIFKRRKLGTI